MLLAVIITASSNAQSWTIGGNTNAQVPAAGGELGTIGNRPIIFETNNVERARLLNTTGFWGFGTSAPNSRVHINASGTTNPFRIDVVDVARLVVLNSGRVGINTTAPSARLHINSISGEDGLRVQIAGSTKLLVDDLGGVTIGSTSAAPANGLYVSGNTTIGTSLPATGFRTTINEPSGSALILGTLNGVGSYLTVNRPSASTSTETVRVRDNGTTFATFNTTAATYQLTVYGDALASGGTWQNSDKRIKRDIKVMDNALDNIMKLKPSAYYFKRDEASYKYLNMPKELQFGLIAQEVKEVFPNLVREYKTTDEDGKERSETMHSVNYTALIPVLIKGIQEQQKTINDLQERLAKLESGASVKSSSMLDITSASSAVLEQNKPNPFNQVTTIRYKIAPGANAHINIYDATGVVVKSMRANESGQVQINASELRSGTYTYSLIVDGRPIASKKMVMLQ